MELEPRRKTLYAKRRARFLVDFVANKVRDAAAAEQPVAWVEVIFRVGAEFPFKTLVRWDAAHEVWMLALETGQWKGEIWNRRADGEIYPEWLSVRAVRDDHGEVSNYVGAFSDISEKAPT